MKIADFEREYKRRRSAEVEKPVSMETVKRLENEVADILKSRGMDADGDPIEGEVVDDDDFDEVDSEDFFEAVDLLETCHRVLGKLTNPSTEYTPVFIQLVMHLQEDVRQFIGKHIVVEDLTAAAEESEV